VTGFDHLLDQSFRRERTDSADNGAAGETSIDHQIKQTVQRRSTTDKPHNRLLGGKKGLCKTHPAEHRETDRVRIAVPGFDPFVECRQKRGHREDLGPASRADPDRADRPRLSDRPLDRFQAIPQVERIHTNGLEIRFQQPKPSEARGSKRVTAPNQDQSIVRHETKAGQDMAFVEPNRRDQRPKIRTLTRGGVRFPERAR